MDDLPKKFDDVVIGESGTLEEKTGLVCVGNVSFRVCFSYWHNIVFTNNGNKMVIGGIIHLL